MSAGSHQQLHQLYIRLGEAFATRQKGAEAADAFALALYYARQMGDSERANACRQRIADINPNHVAARELSAPLLFAQLLMRYPADEAERALSELGTQRVAWHASASVVTADAGRTAVAMAGQDRSQPAQEVDPYQWLMDSNDPPTAADHAQQQSASQVQAHAGARTPTPTIKLAAFTDLGTPAAADVAKSPSKQPNQKWMSMGSRTEPVSPPEVKARPKMPAEPEQEIHHVYDLGDTKAPPRRSSFQAADDFLLKSTAFPDTESSIQLPTGPNSRLLNTLAGLMAVTSVIAIAFFGYQLYPAISKVQFRDVVQLMLDGKLNRPDADNPIAVPEPSLETAVASAAETDTAKTESTAESPADTFPAIQSTSLKPPADLGPGGQIELGKRPNSDVVPR